MIIINISTVITIYYHHNIKPEKGGTSPAASLSLLAQEACNKESPRMIEQVAKHN